VISNYVLENFLVKTVNCYERRITVRFFILPFLCVVVMVIGCTTDQTDEIVKLKEEIANLKTIVGPPPRSLDSLYPPKAEAPILLLRMFELATSLAGIVGNSFEKDLENANAQYEKFKLQYVELSKLVPEWKKAYAMEPVEELGMAIRSGDYDKMLAAFGKIDKVCYDCHITNTTKVQQKYHWGDFYGIGLTDPVTNEDVDFRQLKQRLWSSLGGIGVDLEEGQLKYALKHFEAFKGRFQVLEETCVVCHDTERKYYVDKNVQILIDKLGAALRSASLDPKMVGELSQEIGTESCLKCHWVHSPVAFTKAKWKD
jgi:hypothetical protein